MANYATKYLIAFINIRAVNAKIVRIKKITWNDLKP
jgi:hypothetical protein